MTLDLNMRVSRGSCRSHTLLCSRHCCVRGRIVDHRNESPGCSWWKWGSSPLLLWLQLLVRAAWARRSAPVRKSASVGRGWACCWPHHRAPWVAPCGLVIFGLWDSAAVDLEDASVVEVGLFVAFGASSSNIWAFGWKYVVRSKKGL